MSVQKFVLSGDSGVLRSVLQILATDVEAAVLSVVEDRRAQVERLVVLLDEERAEALVTALGGRLQVEPDAPLLDPDPANGPPGPLFPPLPGPAVPPPVPRPVAAADPLPLPDV